MQLDERDKQLISLLQKNGRESVVSLSKQLGVSRATIQNRIEMLERRKIIKGFTVLFDDEYQNRLLRVLMSINLKAGVSRHVIKALKHRPLVTKILSVSGIYDLIIEITVQTTIELDTEIDDIRELEGIEQTITSVVLADYH
jgi:DNA-binding Lrp family transcriptional regulator